MSKAIYQMHNISVVSGIVGEWFLTSFTHFKFEEKIPFPITIFLFLSFLLNQDIVIILAYVQPFARHATCQHMIALFASVMCS
jgi:hypothetical protein